MVALTKKFGIKNTTTTTILSSLTLPSKDLIGIHRSHVKPRKKKEQIIKGRRKDKNKTKVLHFNTPLP